jgi:hypothetical protein
VQQHHGVEVVHNIIDAVGAFSGEEGDDAK